jgi:Rrf2 family protein
MRLGRASSYAVFAVVYLAEHSDGAPIQGREIAESCGMPTGRLLKILQQLVRTRILASERGPSGGFRLRKPPAEITLLEIVETTEGPIEGDLAVPQPITGMARPTSVVETACADVATFARTRFGKVTIATLLR